MAEKKPGALLEPWKDLFIDKFDMNIFESLPINIIAIINNINTNNNFNEVKNRCNMADSLTPEQFNNVKKIMQNAAAIFAIGVSFLFEFIALCWSSSFEKDIPRYTDSKYRPNTVAIIAYQNIKINK